MRFAHVMPFGAAVLPGGGTRFRLWAPSRPRVDLMLHSTGDIVSQRLPMTALTEGWHELMVEDAMPGTRYQYLVRGRDGAELLVPDPASRSNPNGVHGASMVLDPHSYTWQTPQWSGAGWPEAVVYELHIGAFTREGTYAAAEAKLPQLAELGINTLQIMPLAAFSGARNWGYDGVLQYAPAACYGTPTQLKSLVDAAHGLNMMVMLDVVYNHFGPEGNYLHAYSPEFFRANCSTPWGEAINFDGPASATVREFFIHNALYWIQEFRFDGLRLDAVHAIQDSSVPDIVCDIARAMQEATRERRARAAPGRSRRVHLVLENNCSTAQYLQRDPSGRPQWATAQWDDDVHHALHVVVTGERDGYYADYTARPLHKLGASLTEGFVDQSEHSHYRGRTRGAANAGLPPTAFVGFLQNHDMVGNRALGERLAAVADPTRLRAAYACLLLTPHIPMLFMGEEFAASTPFLFFCDFSTDLAVAVAAGRRRELERFAAFSRIDSLALPDPAAKATFEASKLRWQEREQGIHGERLALIRALLALRKAHLEPYLSGIALGGRFRVEGSTLRAEWTLHDETQWCLLAHFGEIAAHTSPWPSGRIIYREGVETVADGVTLAPGATLVMHSPTRMIVREENAT